MKDAERIVRAYLEDPQAEPLIRQAFASVLVTQQRLTDAAEQLRLGREDAPEARATLAGPGRDRARAAPPEEAERRVEAGARIVSANPSSDAEAARPPPMPGRRTRATPRPVGRRGADERHGRLARVQLLLARAAEMRHDDATAAQWLSRVDAKDADLQVIALRASLLARQGKLADARQMVRTAPASTPAEQRYRLLTEVQLLLDNKKLEDARALLSKANAETPNDVDLLYQEADGLRAPGPRRGDGAAAAPHPRAAAQQLAGDERPRATRWPIATCASRRR
jgi:hypothetical protein